MDLETEAKKDSSDLQLLAAEKQAEREGKVRRDREGHNRYESVFQPYDAAWNALDGELWSRDASRAAAAIERVVATAKALETWDGDQLLTEWLAWLPESLESQQDAASKGIALALAGTIETGVCSHDDAAALISLTGENHPCNQVARLRRAKPVVENDTPKETTAAETDIVDGSSKNAAEFLAQRRETIEAKNEERRQAGDAAVAWDEKFTQPWNKAWESFEIAIESTYSKPGDIETIAALVAAIRRIVKLAKGTDYEDRIRLAAGRCQRLFKRDPTGNSFHHNGIADRAAILTVIQATLDDTAAIEELASGLRVTSPFAGIGCKREVEYARQMVMLQAGLPKKTPVVGVQSAGLIHDSFTRCRERLEAAAEKHRALAVMLVHQSKLGNKAEPCWPENYENQAHYQLTLGGGPRCDVRQRTYSLYGKMFQGSEESSYSEAVDEYNDAAAELGQLLDDLPEAARQVLWRGWPHGFVKHNAADFWTNAVFELAWQKLSVSRLKAERFAWHENYKLKIDDLPKMRTSDLLSMGKFAELVERVGDPPAFWYSWINNIWRASISAIDLLISMLRQTPGEIVSQLSPDGIAGVRALVLHLQVHNHPRVHALRFQEGIRNEQGDALAAVAELERLGIIEGKHDSYQQATVYSFDGDFVKAILAELPVAISVEQPADDDGAGDVPLSVNKQDILTALLDKGAIDSDHRTKAEDIAVAVAGATADVNAFKAPLSELVAESFISSKTGRGGGYWLTETGKDRSDKQ